MKGVFFYQTEARRYMFQASTAATTNQACYARMMMERAQFAEEMLDRGDSQEAAWKFFQTGEF
jgi:hypothetical protein